tara:strand:- start:681 stop:1697 length:1017 start_codon:yes stop_codon:yes gene_type:complete
VIKIGIKKFSKIIIKSDNSSWVLDELKKELEFSLKKKFNFIHQRFLKFFKNQSIFFINKYDLLKEKKYNNKIGLSLFHFDPSRKSENKKIIKLIKVNNNIKCVQVTNNKIKNYLIQEGVSKKKIFKIPIGIDIKKFPYCKINKKNLIKKIKKLNKFLVIGSFQKDGIGWADGNKPKMIKGPDIFIKIIQKLKKKVPIHVVLTGPSRGYVINKLKKMRVSYEYHNLKNYDELHKYYELLDCYIVSSRYEGGPRSILESMASGVPIYSTKVGQAQELIVNGSNGWLYDKKKIDKLTNLICSNFNNKKSLTKILKKARNTALDNDHKKHLILWNKFFKNLK